MRFLPGYRDFVPALALGADDDADRLARRFEDRPLLDMRLEIGVNRIATDRLGTGKADPPEFGAEGDPCQVVGTGRTSARSKTPANTPEPTIAGEKREPSSLVQATISIGASVS